MVAAQLLFAVLVMLGNGGWAYPGMVESMSGSSTVSKPLTTHSPYSVTTVYETTCSHISTRSTSSTSSKSVSSTSGKSSSHGSSSGGSTRSTATSTASDAKSVQTHECSVHTAVHTLSVEQSSSYTSKAQDASTSSSSGQHVSHKTSTSESTSQRSKEQSISNSQTSEIPRSTPRTSTSSTGISTTSRSKSSTSRYSTSTSTQSSSFSTTSTFSFSVPSGYTLVKLSSSSSTESVPSGFSLEPLSGSTSSSSSSTTFPSTTPNSSTNASTTSGPSSNLASNSTSLSFSTLQASLSFSSSLNATSKFTSFPSSSRSIQTGVSSSALTAPGSSGSAVASNATVSSVASASKVAAQSALSASAASVVSVASAASASKAAASETATPANCNDGTWDLTVANYNKFYTDINLQIWWNGGKDNETGVTFPAKTAPGTFLTEALAGSFEPVGSEFVCTLEQHSCTPADECTNYAVHIPSGVPQTGVAQYFNDVGPATHYGWFAIHSIANIYSFSETFTSGLVSAGIQIASENMQLTQTFTKPVNQDIATRSILLGFALLVAILFAFIPVVGEVMGASVAAGAAAGAAAIAATGTSTAASFIGVSLANGATLDTKAATFGAYMGMIFNTTAGAVDQLVSQLMNGLAINAAPGTTDPTIFGMLEGGKWLNSSVITNPNLSITAMTEVMRDDLIQRGINYVWSQSKIYVTFADLNDDANGTNCQADRNGWQASKTCADGGVYYLYRFNEDGHLIGHLDYPWGADKMTDEPFEIQPSWVTKSSAASYRAQNGGVGGFNYDQTTPPTNLTDILTEVGNTGTLDGLHTLPGVWNISVCDMGTHNDWNGDFTQKPMVTENKDNLSFFFPCCCGPQCSQTQDFVRSAQMENFKTIYDTCKTQLTLCEAWPAGVTSIDFGDAGTITNKNCLKGDTMPVEPDYEPIIP